MLFGVLRCRRKKLCEAYSNVVGRIAITTSATADASMEVVKTKKP